MNHRLLTLILSLCLLIPAWAQQQQHRRPDNPYRNIVMKVGEQPAPVPGEKVIPLPHKQTTAATEVLIGETMFDLQTNSTAQRRIYVYPDGTIGATWTMGFESASWSDRGTGYNYYNGVAWGSFPTIRIENTKTGWPGYAAWGSGGELVVAHTGTSNGLALNKCQTKGSGLWMQTYRPGPATHPNILWPRVMTSGANHDSIHIIALTAPVANGGTVYNGMDGALLYYRSSDGGITWSQQHVQPTGLNSTNYVGFGGDQYAWANAVGDTLAFVMGDDWLDIILMKSTDGGNTWTRSVVFAHPYQKFVENTTLVLDTPWVCDGSLAIALDRHGKAHITFGIMRVLNDDLTDGTTSYFPFTDGLAYWNEDELPFTSLDIDSVDDRGLLIGWAQDINGNGTLDLVSTATTTIGLYYASLSSMPQIHVDQMDNIFVVYSGIIEGIGNGVQNYRRIYGRGRIGGISSWDTIFNITSSIIHNFDECVFPSIAPTSDGNIHILYQVDDEPGLAVRGDLDPPFDNGLIYCSIPKTDFLMSVGSASLAARESLHVSPNYPNPFGHSTSIRVRLDAPADLFLTLRNMTGQVVMQRALGSFRTGESVLQVDGSGLSNGLYLYTISDGKNQAGGKMAVLR